MRNWHCRRNGAKKKRKPRRRPGSSKFRYNYHHIYPKSRRKCGDLGRFEELFGSLRLWVQIKKQKAWHAVFSNLMPEEALFLIRKCFENGIDYANPVPEIIGAVKSRLYPPRNGNADITPADLAAWKEIFQDIRGFKNKLKTKRGVLPLFLPERKKKICILPVFLYN